MDRSNLPGVLASEAALPGRSDLIDAIRAVALLGVIVMNTAAVTMVIAADRVMATATPLDYAAGLTAGLVFQGKARACFAFLFGMGFGILLDRAGQAGRGFSGYYARRMAALFAFGLINQAFLFWGDILAHYALIGLLLMLVRACKDRTLLWAGGALILVPPVVIAALPLLLGHPIAALASGPEAASAYGRAALPIYTEGSYLEVVQHNLGRQLHAYAYDTAHRLEYDLSLLGLFILGLLAARRRLLLEVDRHRSLLRRVAGWCVPFGLLFSMLYLTRPFRLPLGRVMEAAAEAAFFGPSLLALGLVALIALSLSRRGALLRACLAPVGRMALTNYLASGAIASWITYGYGLAQLGRLNLAALVLLGIGIFLGLALFSHAWLATFRLGPAEWLWRSLSHARRQHLLRPRPAPSLADAPAG